MAIVVKPAPINSFNIGLNDLHDKINHVIKNKKYSSYKEAVKSINKNVLDYDLTTEYKTSSVVSTDTVTTPDNFNYVPPLLSDDIINSLTKDNNIIFNKYLKNDTYYNKPLFYINFRLDGTNLNNTVYVYGYNPGNYTYYVCKNGLYLCSNNPFFFLGIAPFTLKQYYTLINL